jgi:hypothetical protein
MELFCKVIVRETGILAGMFLFLFIPRALHAEPGPESVLDLEKMKSHGRWVEVEMPDTLDLVDRARLSIHVLTNNVEPKSHYGVYQSFTYNRLPHKMYALTWNITPKNARNLPGLRSMTGNTDMLNAEYGMMKSLLNQIEEDGQMYYPFDGAGPPKGTSYPQINALTIFAMLNFMARDSNPGWKTWIDTLARGLRRTAIRVEDRAYFPMQSGIDRKGKWHFMHHNSEMPMPYTPPDEPKSDAEGLEGAAKSDQIRSMSALVKHYRLAGDEASLDTARRILKFVMKPEMWEDTSDEGYPGHEHGIWSGHFHNGTNALMGLLDIALVFNDQKLLQIVREGYDHAVRQGIVRIGWFPAWSKPTSYNRPAILEAVTEPCAMADMICLAIMMNDAGLGDYWDDVDAIMRNTLIAQQITDLERFRAVAGTEPGSEDDVMLKRFIGGFSNGSPNYQGQFDMAGCCTANGGQAIYYAWHGITRFNRGVATVNLFLNRVSPWMDVMSHVPYEGRVELHNKQAVAALVRIPRWVDRNHVQYTVNGRQVRPRNVGHSVLFQGLDKGDRIRLDFPIETYTDHYTIGGKTYEVLFKGSTVIRVKGPADNDTGPLFDGMGQPLEGSEIRLYKMYNRENYLADKAPVRMIRRFEADQLIPLGTF